MLSVYIDLVMQADENMRLKAERVHERGHGTDKDSACLVFLYHESQACLVYKWFCIFFFASETHI